MTGPDKIRRYYGAPLHEGLAADLAVHGVNKSGEQPILFRGTHINQMEIMYVLT